MHHFLVSSIMRIWSSFMHPSPCLFVMLCFMTSMRSAMALESRLVKHNFAKLSAPSKWRSQTNLYSTSGIDEAKATSAESSVEHHGGLAKNFISNIIEEDLKNNKNQGRVLTRFPPEPNGYLHLGHAKSIFLNFGIAKQYNGKTNMRFDDTNPAKEDMEYVTSILNDVRWLTTGDTQAQPAPWDGEVRHASDYFPLIYQAAEFLITRGLAYVDDLTADQMKEYRGSLTEPGRDSPYRTRSPEENLRLFRQMRDGHFPDGHCVLRAKIDMASSNVNLRDPALYRIKRETHPITGDSWCIYPMYDFAHALSDAAEQITHSLCTLEFADHRPLYDWTIEQVLPSGLLPPALSSLHRPCQHEFARLNVQYTVLSKRKLITLVEQKAVNGWDDPRLPTIAALRRRGVPPSALSLFVNRVGVSRGESLIDLSLLEECTREVLDASAPRLFALQQPLLVTLTNFPSEREERFFMESHPRCPELGGRDLVLTRQLYIERSDFFDTGPDGSLSPPKGYKRLVPGGTLRLKFAYAIQCDEVLRNTEGEVVELRCSYDPSSIHGQTPQAMKRPKGIVQWLSPQHSLDVKLRLYDRLFSTPAPGKESGDYLRDLNPSSLVEVQAKVERSLLERVEELGTGEEGERELRERLRRGTQPCVFQFERVGYFALDYDTGREEVVFNRVVTLKDSWGSKKGDE